MKWLSYLLFSPKFRTLRFLGRFPTKKKQKKAKRQSGITCVCSLAGSHRRRCGVSGWPAGPSSGFYRCGTRPLSPSRPEGGASGRSETPSSRVVAAAGPAPVPLQRKEEAEEWKSCHIHCTQMHFVLGRHHKSNIHIVSVQVHVPQLFQQFNINKILRLTCSLHLEECLCPFISAALWIWWHKDWVHDI